MLKVSCALIIDQNKILVVQRNTGSDHPLKWEFPGGKLNQGEIILNEHHDFKWVSPGSLEKVDFAEADRKLIQVRINQVELKKHLRKNMNDTR